MIIYNYITSLHIQDKESYALNYIASVELGAKNENPYDTFKDWYTKDYQSFIDYNIVDVELVDQLEDKDEVVRTLFDYGI